MDFRSLNRRELQSLCKINKIPANITNIAMADALKSLETVVGIDEILNSSRSETAGSSIEFPMKIEITSPKVSYTSCRTSTWKKVKKSETEPLLVTASRASRGVRSQLAGEVDDFLKTPSVSSPRKKGTTTSTRKNIVNRETTMQRVYNTRRSARLTEKKCIEPSVTEKETSQPVKIASFLEEVGVTSEESCGSVETSHESNIIFENVEDNVGEGSVENCDKGILKAKVEDICVEFQKLDVVTVDGSDQNLLIEKVDYCENLDLEEKQKVEKKFIINEPEKKDQVDIIKPDSEGISNLCEDGNTEKNLTGVEKNDPHDALNVYVNEHDVYLAPEEHSESSVFEKLLTEVDGGNADSISFDTENPSDSSGSVSEMKNEVLECNVIKADNQDDYNVAMKMTTEGIKEHISKNAGTYFVETSHESNISFENREDNVREGNVENCDDDILKAKLEDSCIDFEKLDALIVDGSDLISEIEKVDYCGENLEEIQKGEKKFILNELETFEEISELVDIIKPDSEGISSQCEDGDSEEKMMVVCEKIDPRENVSDKEHNAYLVSEQHSDSLLCDKDLSETDGSNADSFSCDIENPSDPSGSVSEMINGFDPYEALNVSLKEHNVYLASEEHTDSLLCDIVLSESDGINADSISCGNDNPSDSLGCVSDIKNEVLECNGFTYNYDNPSERSKLDNPENYNVANETTVEPVGTEEKYILTNIVDEVLVNPNDQEQNKDFETSEEAQESLIKEPAIDIMPIVYQETKETITDVDKATHKSVPDVIDHPTHLTPVENHTSIREMIKTEMVADNIDSAGGEGFTSQPPSNRSLSPQSPQTSSISASKDTPAGHSGQISRRRSTRSVGSYKGEKDSDHNKHPAKKKPRTITASESSPSSGNDVSFFIGDPVPDEEARRRWPWRYDCEGPKSDGCGPKPKDNDDDDDMLVLNVKCHYLQTKIETHVFDLGDCATVKGEGDHDHVGRILEFFKTNDNEDFFRVQWFFRAEDTVIKDASSSNDKKRLFYSTLMNDNALDCIVSKVKVVKIQPGVNLKSIPVCDYYYDMKYSIDYSTFSTIKDDVSSNNCCLSSRDNNEEINCNGSIDNNSNETITKFKPQNLELTLLDMYSGCGGMSTGLRFGAKLSGVDLSTKWAVDANEDACESLRLNHPETQIRNESAEDFLDLIKEWDKLCKKYPVKKKTQHHDTMLAGPPDDVIPTKEHNFVPKDEYEVEKLVDICYSELDGTSKRGLKFKVRWSGYGPSDDTWEPIEELSKCKDKIREFVQKGVKANILPRPGDVGIICGGPPCQGISGYNRHRNLESPLEDEKNYQIVLFMEIINFLKPKYILMENVVDILRLANGCLARYAISCLVRDYYQVRLGVMAAGCYGLPQFRLRVFLWGAHANMNLPPFPLPTHDVVFKYGAASGFERNVVAYDEGQLSNLEKCVLLKDAISDLPPVSNTEIRDKMKYISAPETEFQKFIRATKSDMLGIASGSLREVEKPLLHDHRPLPLNGDDYLRVCRIPKRKGANFRDLPGVVSDDGNAVSRTSDPELMPSGKHWVPDYALNFRHKKNTRSFARLWWDETVSTVLCTPNFRAEPMLHPEQDRVLTIRENARLQGFPDYYALSGSVKERYRQVGNAVAVPVGRALGYALGMALQKLTGDEPLITLPPKFAHSTTVDLLQSRLATNP
ncbi:hypothetical protein L1987_72630 [Smallanthus sonchifolius]|uniref:Uncharacterized protein n=1 Tax=Smallanthus sonchifolius TaxID=185202 RepID=A0ACB9B060_9ASTR|nr:hypothetical protein L1987_72630 [Smallanthus sonchifolius]